jgi:hypothetical protein
LVSVPCGLRGFYACGDVQVQLHEAGSTNPLGREDVTKKEVIGFEKS